MGIFRFSPGTCRQTCGCDHCNANGTPTRWTVTVIGEGDFQLSRNPGAPGCVWEKRFPGGRNFICADGDPALYMAIMELTLECNGSGARLHLQCRTKTGSLLASWTGAYSGPASPNCDFNCLATAVLSSTGLGTCASHPQLPATVSAVPGGVMAGCCGCDDDGSGGSGGGISDPGVFGCVQCCSNAYSNWELDFGALTPVWTDRDCNNCDQVKGAFTLSFYDKPLPNLCRFRYLNTAWCADIAPCAGGDIGLLIYLYVRSGVEGTHGPTALCVPNPACDLLAGVFLYRSTGLDDIDCYTECSQWYLSNCFARPTNCLLPITLHRTGHNQCPDRAVGNPLCVDHNGGHDAPATIIARTV